MENRDLVILAVYKLKISSIWVHSQILVLPQRQILRILCHGCLKLSCLLNPYVVEQQVCSDKCKQARKQTLGWESPFLYLQIWHSRSSGTLVYLQDLHNKTAIQSRRQKWSPFSIHPFGIFLQLAASFTPNIRHKYNIGLVCRCCQAYSTRLFTISTPFKLQLILYIRQMGNKVQPHQESIVMIADDQQSKKQAVLQSKQPEERPLTQRPDNIMVEEFKKISLQKGQDTNSLKSRQKLSDLKLKKAKQLRNLDKQNEKDAEELESFAIKSYLDGQLIAQKGQILQRGKTMSIISIANKQLPTLEVPMLRTNQSQARSKKCRISKML